MEPGDMPDIRTLTIQKSPLRKDVVGLAGKFIDDFLLASDAEGIYDSMGVTADKTFLLAGKPGCLSGDTVVGINRGGKSIKISMKELYEKTNGKITRGHSWDKKIISKIRTRDNDGYIRLSNFKSILYSGKKKTYEIIASNGNRIRATEDHPFLTPTGWKQVSELTCGDNILLEKPRGGKGRTKIRYKEIRGLKFHKYAHGSDKYAVAYHRLVVEADLNNLDIDYFIKLCRCGFDNRKIKYLNPKTIAVHHIDGNAKNNSLNNLEALGQKEHAKLHSKNNWKNVNNSTGVYNVVSILFCGEEDTYDIELGHDPHNFIANGFVVHNTGKTLSIRAINNQVNQKVYDKVIEARAYNMFRREGDDIKVDLIEESDILVFSYDIGSMGTAYINMGSRIVQHFFDTAGYYAQCGKKVLIELDEADALLGDRRSATQSHSEDNKVLETIMKNLQIAHDTPNMYVALMSNIPEACDEASLRAGRIDKKYVFKNPNLEERTLGYQFSINQVNDRAGYKVVRQANAEALANMSKGFSYADITATVDAAVKERATEIARDRTDKIIPASYVTQKRLKESVKQHMVEFNIKTKPKRKIGF